MWGGGHVLELCPCGVSALKKINKYNNRVLVERAEVALTGLLEVLEVMTAEDNFSPLLGWTCGGSTTGAVKLGRITVGHQHAGALYPPICCNRRVFSSVI